jgi:hypothetical protein
MLGLELEEDLLSWMAGEFSLALVPASPEALTSPENRQTPQLGAGVVFMVQASDRTRAEATLQKLDELMATRYQFQVAKTQQGGQPVTKWISPLGGLSATHGWLEGSVVFLTLGAPIAGSIVPQPPATLTQTSLFQQAVPTKPNPNNGQFFLDVERSINSGTLNLSQFLSQEQKMLSKAIRSLGITTAHNDKHSNRFDLFVQLKRVNTPNNSPDTTPSLSSPSKPSLPQPSLSSPSVPQTPRTTQTPSISPSVPQTPRTTQTPSISPSVPPKSQVPQTPSPSISPSIPPQSPPQTPSGSVTTPQNPQMSPKPSP